MSEANTIWIQLYTPGGAKLGVTLGFADGKFTETLPDVALIDAMIAEKGYLLNAPGVEPGETLETITHVIRGIQTNKDGTTTPIIGLFYENTKLIYPKKAYLNTTDDIATFERLSGLKVSALPQFPSKNVPLRDDAGGTPFMVAVKTPFQIKLKPTTYVDPKDGETKEGTEFAGFYDPAGKPAPAQPSTPASGNGNTGSQGSAATGSGDGDKTIDLTEQMLKDYTIHMYKHAKHQEASFKSLRENGVLTTDMKPFTAACHVLMHRALTDYMMDADIVKEALGGSLKDHLATDGNSLITAWNMITVFANSHKQTAN